MADVTFQLMSSADVDVFITYDDADWIPDDDFPEEKAYRIVGTKVNNKTGRLVRVHFYRTVGGVSTLVEGFDSREVLISVANLRTVPGFYSSQLEWGVNFAPPSGSIVPHR